MKNHSLLSRCIELESLPMGVIATGNTTIVVAPMDKMLRSFSLKGRKNWAIKMPNTIMTMCQMKEKRGKMKELILIALGNGAVRMYNGKSLIDEFCLPKRETAMGMRFGTFSREDSALMIVTRSGSVHVKALSRRAKLDEKAAVSGPPPEQEQPLPVPKKTKLYVESTQREREQATEMHRIFQRDLCKVFFGCSLTSEDSVD